MIQLADIFKSGMTLQQQKQITIWGRTTSVQKLQLFLDDSLLSQGEFPAGKFQLILPAQKAGENHILKVEGSSGDIILLHDVDIGEVWIAGGQSNMEFPMAYEPHFKNEMKQFKDQHLRFYDVPKYAFDGEETDGLKKSLGYGVWRTCKRTDLKYFSAAGYYFAKQLREKYRIPVAIVGCNWGGTSASTWLDEKLLQEDPALAVYWNEYQEGLKTINLDTYAEENRKARESETSPVFQWIMRKMVKGKIGPILKAVIGKLASKSAAIIGPHSSNRPGGLYHAMVEKIAGFACRGVIWYQGESDDVKADLYARLFTNVIECWRKAWFEELPFLFVQLAPFGQWLGISGQKYPIIRAQQEQVSKAVANTAIACIMDDGDENDIHPKNKKVVGERLALLARAKVYGENILCESPEAVQANRVDNRIEVRFANYGNGLKLKGNRISALRVVCGDRECKISEIRTETDRLLVYSDSFSQAKEMIIHFADVGYCQVNVFNSVGLPVKPFIMKVEVHNE